MQKSITMENGKMLHFATDWNMRFKIFTGKRVANYVCGGCRTFHKDCEHFGYVDHTPLGILNTNNPLIATICSHCGDYNAFFSISKETVLVA